MSPSTYDTRSAIPFAATISRPIRALPGRSTTTERSSGCCRQSAIEYSPCAPATSSNDAAPEGNATAFATAALESRASWYWPVMYDRQ